MVKKFIDAAPSTEKESMVVQDGTALSLVGSARILYDDTLNKRQLATTIQRIAERIESLPTASPIDVNQVMLCTKFITLDGKQLLVTED